MALEDPVLFPWVQVCLSDIVCTHPVRSECAPSAPASAPLNVSHRLTELLRAPLSDLEALDASTPGPCCVDIPPATDLDQLVAVAAALVGRREQSPGSAALAFAACASLAGVCVPGDDLAPLERTRLAAIVSFSRNGPAACKAVSEVLATALMGKTQDWPTSVPADVTIAMSSAARSIQSLGEASPPPTELLSAVLRDALRIDGLERVLRRSKGFQAIKVLLQACGASEHSRELRYLADSLRAVTASDEAAEVQPNQLVGMCRQLWSALPEDSEIASAVEGALKEVVARGRNALAAATLRAMASCARHVHSDAS
jgi:hypothetical protein